jgi:hypothetical protein
MASIKALNCFAKGTISFIFSDKSYNSVAKPIRSIFMSAKSFGTIKTGQLASFISSDKSLP